MKKQKVAILTAGGLAPCLSSAIGYLIQKYTDIDPSIEIICYLNGYQGLLLGESVTVNQKIREQAGELLKFGGSPIGNSRVKLTNTENCLKRGLIQEGQNPQQVAADQLVKDGITILHTIGGDDTNTSAADLANFLHQNNYELTVVGLPKTVDNDVYPIQQSLGAWTAAEEGAKYFENVVAEHSANPRMLIIHEVMGRNCGWLTVATALAYRERLAQRTFIPEIGFSKERHDIHGLYIPEMELDIQSEANRLKNIMDTLGNVNLFISEGAGVSSIVNEMMSRGENVPRDAFGHVKLDAVNPGHWFGKQFAQMLNAEKILVQKSGYFSRAAAPNAKDLKLIKLCAEQAVNSALRGESGVSGHDEDQNNVLRTIEFNRIKGGKPFDLHQPDLNSLLKDINQNFLAMAN